MLVDFQKGRQENNKKAIIIQNSQFKMVLLLGKKSFSVFQKFYSAFLGRPNYKSTDIYNITGRKSPSIWRENAENNPCGPLVKLTRKIKGAITH